MKKLNIFGLLLCCSLVSVAQGLVGTWNGKLAVGPQSLTIVLNIGEGGCTLDSPDQGVKGIPCETVYLSQDSVNVKISSFGAVYAARLVDGRLGGLFTQMGYSFRLVLEPGEVKPDRPQTPRPPYGYETREVTFDNVDAGVSLSGTLSLPAGYGSGTPVVLMVTGSGLQNRDEEIFDHRPFAVIADYLARNGIASLRYDDRGFGKSTGDASQATTADFYSDAEAGITYLRNLESFGKVGVIGHSEGGMIAFGLAAKGDVDFAISLASPAMRGDSLLAEQNRALLAASGIPSPYIDNYLAAFVDVLRQRLVPHDPAKDARAVVDSIVAAKGCTLPKEAVENLVAVLAESNEWLDYYISYSPQADIRSAQCPVMAVGGSKDMQVAPGNIEIIRSLLPQNEHNMVKIYDGLNHLFQHCTTGSVTEYNSIAETISPEVLSDVARWIVSVGQR